MEIYSGGPGGGVGKEVSNEGVWSELPGGGGGGGGAMNSIWGVGGGGKNESL